MGAKGNKQVDKYASKLISDNSKCCEKVVSPDSPGLGRFGEMQGSGEQEGQAFLTSCLLVEIRWVQRIQRGKCWGTAFQASPYSFLYVAQQSEHFRERNTFPS